MLPIEPVPVIIPYLPAAAQGREIEYAVAGWIRHFRLPFHIYIVGEGLAAVPDWLHVRPEVTLVESPRVPEIPGQYRQHLDYVSCLRKVRALVPDSEGFIMVADDCYCVNDFGLTDVKFLKMQEPSLGTFSENSPNGWKRDKARTREALLKAGLPTRNYTTHLPQWYAWDVLESLWEKYDMAHRSYVMEDLYYNSTFRHRIPFQLDPWRDNLKLGVYTRDPAPAALGRAFFHKIWITNSPEGWSPELRRQLDDYFDIEHRFM